MYEIVRASGLCRGPSKLDFALGRRFYRTDIHEKALRRSSATAIQHQVSSAPGQPYSRSLAANENELENQPNPTELWTALNPLKL
jgi:hypothetical protein